MDSDPDLARRYGDSIPILFVNGRLFAKIRLPRLAAALRLRRAVGRIGPKSQKSSGVSRRDLPSPLFRYIAGPRCGHSSAGRASASQAGCRRFEPGCPLQQSPDRSARLPLPPGLRSPRLSRVRSGPRPGGASRRPEFRRTAGGRLPLPRGGWGGGSAPRPGALRALEGNGCSAARGGGAPEEGRATLGTASNARDARPRIRYGPAAGPRPAVDSVPAGAHPKSPAGKGSSSRRRDLFAGGGRSRRRNPAGDGRGVTPPRGGGGWGRELCRYAGGAHRARRRGNLGLAPRGGRRAGKRHAQYRNSRSRARCGGLVPARGRSQSPREEEKGPERAEPGHRSDPLGPPNVTPR